MEAQEIAELDYLDRLITETEAAEFLNFSISTLRNWRVTGHGPEFIKISQRTVRYRRRELNAWSERLKRSNTNK